jgi:hypothetical protein
MIILFLYLEEKKMKRIQTNCCCGGIRRFARMRTTIAKVHPHDRCVQVDVSKLVSLREGRKEFMLYLIVHNTAV